MHRNSAVSVVRILYKRRCLIRESETTDGKLLDVSVMQTGLEITGARATEIFVRVPRVLDLVARLAPNKNVNCKSWAKN